MKRTTGLLFLSHQGLSFMDDLLLAAERVGLQSYVLSSNPADVNKSRVEHLRGRAQVAKFTHKDFLTQKDVTAFLRDLRKQGRRVKAVLSVWEGYRLLMSRANKSLGAADLTPTSVSQLIDKLKLRGRLREEGLSQVQANVLTPFLLHFFQRKRLAKFIKPRVGLGSFGAFRPKRFTRWAEIALLQSQMQKDYEYRSLFGAEPQFIAEDFIEGIELSFEVLVVRKALHFLAVHEKVDVDQEHHAVLENACASPPVSLSKDVVDEGKRFLERCFASLDLTTGCFHVEAKYNWRNQRWEIIEINPRVGGAFIKESVRAMCGDLDLLEMWVRLLVAKSPSDERQLARRLLQRTPKRARATFFRVFFGKPGQAIRSIRALSMKPEPKLVRISAAVGVTLPLSSREIFLGQALWSWKRQPSFEALTHLKRLSSSLMEVTYESRR